MLIEAYYQRLQQAIADCSIIVKSVELKLRKDATHEGMIKGEIHFNNDSILCLREYVDVEITVERLMYSYQYMDASNRLIFRYDNTDHHRNIPTFPHHKHEASEDNVVSSQAPMLADVLSEIQNLITLSLNDAIEKLFDID